MDSLFLDTNIVLDLLGERDPFYNDAAQIATLADKGEVGLTISALSYATIYYILSRYENKQIVKNKLRKFKTISKTSDLTGTIIEKGFLSNFSDFEDALQYYCALHENCNIIITRNEKDFKASKIAVMNPSEYLKSIRIR